MAKPRNEKPNVSTFADHEVIMPPHKLGKAIAKTGRDLAPDLDAIARAEAALAELSGEFAGWMKAECDRLDAARVHVRHERQSYKARGELYRAAHDIKGQAETFGYPFAAAAAESLCLLLDHAPDKDRIPQALIDQHVDGVRAIIREDARESGNKTAQALALSLRRATDEFLTRENQNFDGDLTAVTAPNLVPND
jgi:chemotaxis protein histidine kinase CheA